MTVERLLYLAYVGSKKELDDAVNLLNKYPDNMHIRRACVQADKECEELYNRINNVKITEV